MTPEQIRNETIDDQVLMLRAITTDFATLGTTDGVGHVNSNSKLIHFNSWEEYNEWLKTQSQSR